MKVFLSYSRKDAPFVRDLSADLEARGIDVWLDTDDLSSAEDDRWRRSVVQGIRESVALVVVLSPDSVHSGSVEREITIAAEMARRIIPIVHRACELQDGFLFELAGVQRVDFVEQPYDDALAQLTRRIGTAAQAKTVPPPIDAAADAVVSEADEPSNEPIEGPTPTTRSAEHRPDPTGRPHDEPLPLRTSQTAPIIDKTAEDLHTAAPMKTPADAHRSGVRRLPAWVLVGLTVSVLVVAIGALILASNNDDSGDATASSPSIDVAADDEAASTDDTQPPSSTQASEQPAATSPGPSTTQSPAGDTGAAAADALVGSLMDAYNNRDWDTVRRMNINHSQNTNEVFDAGWQGLQSQTHVVLRSEQTGTNRWKIYGTLIAWDLDDRGQTTNIACDVWDVDLDAGTAAQENYVGSDGLESRRDDGWVPEEQFTAKANEYCAT